MSVLRHAVIVVALACVCLVTCAAGNHEHIEQHVKAAFLYKFAAYIEWPPSVFANAETSFTIGVIGADEIAEELIKLSNKTVVNQHPVKIKKLTSEDNFDELHLLFIGKNEEKRLQSFLEKVQTKPVLTITESPGALNFGSIINFVSVDDYIRFEISASSAAKCNIKISTRLLDIAQNIEQRRSR